MRLTYDARGQLAGVADHAGNRWEYRYDALGRRTCKTCLREGQEVWRIEYLWDDSNLLAERRIDGERIRLRLYVLDGPVVQARIDEIDGQASVIVYHNDSIGTPEFCTDSTGRVVWRRTATAFGAGHDPGEIDQLIGLPGQYFDADSGLFYNRHRHYDPLSVSYLQPDPIGAGGGWNLFAYTGNPLQSADPLGLATRYNIPNRDNSQHYMLTNDPNLMKMQSITPNMHQISGPTQEVTQAVGQHIPRTMGPCEAQGLANTPQLVVESHGLPGKLQWMKPDGTTEWIDGKTLGKRLAARGFNGDRVVLVVCHAATKDASGHSVGQDLADQLQKETGHKVEVIAGEGVISNLPDGTLVSSMKMRDNNNVPIARVEDPLLATFKSFTAGNAPTVAPGSDHTNTVKY